MISAQRLNSDYPISPLSPHYFKYFTVVILILLVRQPLAQANSEDQTFFKRIPTQFIAALGDPSASSGSGAETWGLWQLDPGPRGVWLKNYAQLEASNGVAPASWQFNPADWWLDENGLIMEQPVYSLPAGKYVVTGDREVKTILTIFEKDQKGDKRWELDYGAKLYDVTHLPCRSARYTATTASNSCSPAAAPQSLFPVSPGGPMPAVSGCAKQDYSVLFVIGVAVEN